MLSGESYAESSIRNERFAFGGTNKFAIVDEARCAPSTRPAQIAVPMELDDDMPALLARVEYFKLLYGFFAHKYGWTNVLL
jgi:hypothetical protein